MIRFIPLFFVLVLFTNSVGCRMCGTCYDYCMPAFTSRIDDYRGCDPLYRAGSVFSQGCEVIDEEGQVIRATNAGNFGVTIPIEQVRPTRSNFSSFSTPEQLESFRSEQYEGSKTTIGRPPQAPPSNGNESEQPLPGIDDLIRLNPAGAPKTGVPEPIRPEVKLPLRRQVTTPFAASQPETIPFASQSAEPVFTVDELRRLDPSVTDIKILNVEDSAK